MRVFDVLGYNNCRTFGREGAEQWNNRISIRELNVVNFSFRKTLARERGFPRPLRNPFTILATSHRHYNCNVDDPLAYSCVHRPPEWSIGYRPSGCENLLTGPNTFFFFSRPAPCPKFSPNSAVRFRRSRCPRNSYAKTRFLALR